MTNEQIIETLREIVRREEGLSFASIVDVSHIINALNEKEKIKKLMMKSIENFCEEF